MLALLTVKQIWISTKKIMQKKTQMNFIQHLWALYSLNTFYDNYLVKWVTNTKLWIHTTHTLDTKPSKLSDILGVGGMSKKSYQDIFHISAGISLLRYVAIWDKTFVSHTVVNLS